MHKHQSCTKHALSYYLDINSESAILLITKVTHVLTHSFWITNDNNFQFFGNVLGLHTNGNARIAMILHYLPTHATLEEHVDILPTLSIDAQLITNLIVMMEKLNPGLSIHHTCCSHLIAHLCKHSPCIQINFFLSLLRPLILTVHLRKLYGPYP